LLIIIFSSIFFTTYQDITTRYNIDIDRLLLNVNIDNPQQSIEHNPGNNISFVLILENGIVIDTLSGPGLPQNVLDSAFGLIESDRNSKSLFSVYPNPAQNNLTLKGPKNSSYMIIDVLGRNILSGKLNNDNEEISVEYLSNGTYFLHINHESDNQIYQVIISR
jgi:hypothetical protein